MQSFTIEQYQNARCWQFETPALGFGLHAATGGRICNGCPKYEGGRCESFRKMIGPPTTQAKDAPAETVRQEAARLGLGVNEVRRRRAARGG